MYQFIEYYNNIILLSRIMELVLVITYLQFIYGTKSVWKCNQYFQNKCHGRVHLSNGNILNRAIQA